MAPNENVRLDVESGSPSLAVEKAVLLAKASDMSSRHVNLFRGYSLYATCYNM